MTAVADRDALRRQAQALRDGGMTYATIAAKLGMADHAVAWKLLNPERAAEINAGVNARRAPAKRAWENANDRGTCPCGETMGIGTQRQGAKVCAGCRADLDRIGRALRRERIRNMWEDGVETREIAKALNSTENSITTELVKMRRAGWDVPTRPPGGLRGALKRGES